MKDGIKACEIKTKHDDLRDKEVSEGLAEYNLVITKRIVIIKSKCQNKKRQQIKYLQRKCRQHKQDSGAPDILTLLPVLVPDQPKHGKQNKQERLQVMV